MKISTPEEIKERETKALAMFAENPDISAIAAEIGVSRATINNIIIKHGLNKQRGIKERNKFIVELARQGKTFAEISAATGLGKRGVSEVLEKYGMDRKPDWAELSDRKTLVKEKLQQRKSLVKISKELNLPLDKVKTSREALGISPRWHLALRNNLIQMQLLSGMDILKIAAFHSIVPEYIPILARKKLGLKFNGMVERDGKHVPRFEKIE